MTPSDLKLCMAMLTVMCDDMPDAVVYARRKAADKDGDPDDLINDPPVPLRTWLLHVRRAHASDDHLVDFMLECHPGDPPLRLSSFKMYFYGVACCAMTKRAVRGHAWRVLQLARADALQPSVSNLFFI